MLLLYLRDVYLQSYIHLFVHQIMLYEDQLKIINPEASNSEPKKEEVCHIWSSLELVGMEWFGLSDKEWHFVGCE